MDSISLAAPWNGCGSCSPLSGVTRQLGHSRSRALQYLWRIAFDLSKLCPNNSDIPTVPTLQVPTARAQWQTPRKPETGINKNKPHHLHRGATWFNGHKKGGTWLTWVLKNRGTPERAVSLAFPNQLSVFLGRGGGGGTRQKRTRHTFLATYFGTVSFWFPPQTA